MKVGRGKRRLLTGALCLAMLFSDLGPMGVQVFASEVGQENFDADTESSDDVNDKKNIGEEKETKGKTEGDEKLIEENGGSSEKNPSDGNNGAGGESGSTEESEGAEDETDLPETGDNADDESGLIEDSSEEQEGDGMQDGESAPEETANTEDVDGEKTDEDEGDEGETVEETVSENTEEIYGEELEENVEVAAVDEQAVTASGECGSNLTWTLEDETLTISGSGKMYDYKVYSTPTIPWKMYRDKIKNLVIENGVTSIGTYAFSDCKNISERLIIPNSVENIGDGAFKNSGFTGSLVIPNSIINVGNYAFENCQGFCGDLIIPDSVTNIGDRAFSGCSGFNGNLIISNNVTDIEWRAFYDCIGLTGKLEIPNGIVNIGSSAFENCQGFVGDLIIPDSVTSIGSAAFANCNGFDGNLTLSNNVVEIGGGAFSFCSGFKGRLIIPDSAKIIASSGGKNQVPDGVFEGCKGFTGNLIIPENMEYIGDDAFRGCSGFTGDLIIPDNVTYIGNDAFCGCNGFTGDLTIPNSVTYIGNDAFSGCKGFTGSLTIGNSVKEIGGGAFYNCSGFTGSLIIPDSVTSIGSAIYSDDHGAFENCSGFTGDLIIPDSVTSIGNCAFMHCSGFTGNLTIGNSVKSIGSGAFYCCNGFVGNLIIPNSVTRIGEISMIHSDYGAFGGCSGFSGNLIISSNVTQIGDNTFLGCIGFSGDLNIPDSVTRIGKQAFYNCNGFTGNLTISNSIEIIEYGTFFNCYGFTGKLIIPDGVRRIGNFNSSYKGAFENCYGFNGDLIIPDSVTSIGYGTFKDCYNFTGDLIIPDNVTSIEQCAFSGCKGFTGNLIISDSVESIGAYAFMDTGIKKIIFKGDAPTMYESFNPFKWLYGKAYYPSWKSGWTDSVKESLRNLTWIPYSEGTTPWLMDTSADTPQIMLTTFRNENITYTENGGYSSSSLLLEFSAIYWYYPSSGQEAVTYEDVKVTVSLPKGLSFSETSNVQQKDYLIGTMEDLDGKRSQKFQDTVYIITDEYTEEFYMELSATADGYSGAQMAAVRIPITLVPDYGSYELQVYSQFTSCTVGIGQAFALRPALVKNGEALKNERGYSFNIANTDVLAITDTKYDEFGPVLALEGKSAGNTTIKITHVASGKDITINLSVIDGIKTYNISDLKNLSEDYGIFNAEIFMDSFKAEKKENGYDITFKAYNGLSHMAAVEVYNQNGELIEIEKIDKFKQHQTSIKETFTSFADLVVSAFNGNLDSFKDKLYSKETTVKIWVPNGGYFIVSNNLSNSIGARMFNGVDMSFSAYEVITGLFKSDDKLDKAKTSAQNKVAKSFVTQLTEAEKKEFISKYEEKVAKKLGKEISFAAVTDFYGDFVDDSKDVFYDIDIDLDALFIDAAVDSGISIAEGTFEKLSGAPGETLKKLFQMNKYLNLCEQVVDMHKTHDILEVKVYINEEDDRLVSGDVIVQNKDGESLANNELKVTDVTNEGSSQYILNKFSGSSEKIRIMDITMYRDSQEVQPSGTIRVKIPLPLGYIPDRSIVYRVEPDGTLTNMNAEYIDGYMVFETEHLSKYVLTDIENSEFVYSIVFFGNGAEKGEMASLTNCKKDVEYTLPKNIFEHSGYRFTEWNTKADGSGDSFADKAVIVNAATENGGVVTLYAQWIEDGEADDPNKGNEDDNSGDNSGSVIPDDIPADGIPSGLWIAGVEDYTYTGRVIKPQVRVYDSNKRLKAGRDYTITYKNNTKANDASSEKTAPTVVVKGKGNYSGIEKATFKILPVNLSDTNVITEDMTVAYNKKVQKKIPAITYNGKKLANKKDFTVSYPDLDRKVTGAYCTAGTYDILLIAKKGGNYTGTRTVKLTITTNNLISKATVKKIPNQAYTGYAIEPELTVSMKNMKLVKDKDYTIAYMDNKQSGTATAILTGIGEYAGTKKVTFKITGTPLAKAAISGIKNKVYDGSGQTQDIILMLNGNTLRERVDYEITYADNTNAGKAVITIKGINAYTGTIKKSFKITAYDMKTDTANKIKGLKSELTCKYLKGGATPNPSLAFGDKKLIEGIDYTVSYKNNKAVTANGTNKQAVLTIKGKGNFKGTFSKSFAITSKDLNDKEFPVRINVPDKGFTNKAGNYISKPILTDADGKRLVSGKDYESRIIYTLEDGTPLTKTDKFAVGTTIKAKVVGKSAYTGELEASYQITMEDFNKAKVRITPKPYTGREITLDKNDLAITLKSSTLGYGKDYEIVEGSYVNNIKKGTAEVMIAGKGNYGGTKIVKFRIISKKFQWFWRLLK